MYSGLAGGGLDVCNKDRWSVNYYTGYCYDTIFIHKIMFDVIVWNHIRYLLDCSNNDNRT